MSSTSTTIPIVSLVVTGAVALGVPSLTALWARGSQKRQLLHDREVRDLTELRALFDEAAGHIAEAVIVETRIASTRMFDAELETASDGSLSKAAVERQKLLAEERVANSARATASRQRMEMRLGVTAPVVRYYGQAVDALSTLARFPDLNDTENRPRVMQEVVNARAMFAQEANKLVKSRLPDASQ